MKKATYFKLWKMSDEELERLIKKIFAVDPTIEKDSSGWWELDANDGEPIEGLDIVEMLEYKGWLEDIVDFLEEEN